MRKGVTAAASPLRVSSLRVRARECGYTGLGTTLRGRLATAEGPCLVVTLRRRHRVLLQVNRPRVGVWVQRRVLAHGLVPGALRRQPRRVRARPRWRVADRAHPRMARSISRSILSGSVSDLFSLNSAPRPPKRPRREGEWQWCVSAAAPQAGPASAPPPPRSVSSAIPLEERTDADVFVKDVALDAREDAAVLQQAAVQGEELRSPLGRGCD